MRCAVILLAFALPTACASPRDEPLGDIPVAPGTGGAPASPAATGTGGATSANPPAAPDASRPTRSNGGGGAGQPTPPEDARAAADVAVTSPPPPPPPDAAPACAPSCKGICTAGTCQPLEVATTQSLKAFAVNGDEFYLLDDQVQGRRFANPDLPLFSLALPAGADATDLQYVDGRLYWSTTYVQPVVRGEVNSCALPGCATAKVIEGRTGYTYQYLTTDAAHKRAVWNRMPTGQASDGLLSVVVVHTAATGGTRAVPGASPIYVSAMAADANDVYWADFQERTVYRAPLDGGTRTALLKTSDMPHIFGLAPAPGSLFLSYEAEGNLPISSIYAVPLPTGTTSGTPAVFHSATPGAYGTFVNDYNYNLVVDGDWVVWIEAPMKNDSTEAQTRIMRCPIAGCQAGPELVSLEPSNASHLVSSPRGLFWIRAKLSLMMMPH